MVKVTSVALAVGFLAISACGQAQHLWYNDPGISGDLLVGSVMVDATAPYTYYEVHGWNEGGLGGGYSGIQDNGNGQHSFIFSIWDPSDTVQMNRAQYVPPGGTYAQRFGGEGAGYQILNPGRVAPLWVLGQWYTIVVRAWDVGSHTFVGAWYYDQTNQLWTLQGIHDYPVQMRFDYGEIAFLENYGGQYVADHRRMFTGWGYKRTPGPQWWPFTSGAYDGPATNANAGTIGSTYFMETGSQVVNTVGSNANFTVPPFGNEPSPPVGQIQSAFAIFDPRSNDFVVSWQPNRQLTPQYSYEVQISNTNAFTSNLTVDQFAIAPEIQRVHVPAGALPHTRCFGRVRVVDVFDRTSAWTTFTVTKGLPVKNFAYLSDLQWASASNGYGPVEKDTSNGESGSGDGHPITLNGVIYAKGIGCHANSQVVYDLGGAYQWFQADVGIDDEISGIQGSAIFRVYVDGVLTYDSSIMNASTTTQHVLVNVTGASQLTLVTDDSGDGNGQDHTDWADARLIRQPFQIANPIAR